MVALLHLLLAALTSVACAGKTSFSLKGLIQTGSKGRGDIQTGAEIRMSWFLVPKGRGWREWQLPAMYPGLSPASKWKVDGESVQKA